MVSPITGVDKFNILLQEKYLLREDCIDGVIESKPKKSLATIRQASVSVSVLHSNSRKKEETWSTDRYKQLCCQVYILM